MIVFIRSAMVREMCCTAPGSATITDWNKDTGINNTSQRDSAMKSATTASPVISASSLNVSPVFNRPSDCRVALSPSAETWIVPLKATPKCVASSPWCMMVSLASNDPTREPSTKGSRRSVEMSRNGLTFSLRNEAMAEVFIVHVPACRLVIHHRS
jgi:hypothetical protein